MSEILEARINMLKEADKGGADLSPIDYALIELWDSIAQLEADLAERTGRLSEIARIASNRGRTPDHRLALTRLIAIGKIALAKE